MTTGDKPSEVKRISCEICLKEVPKSEAIVPEASDYVAYFCGMDCYTKWKNQPDKLNKQVKQPGQ